ncbi:hypothetical protein BDR04DRAFT_1123610, partial [Suillus decipiens]
MGAVDVNGAVCPRRRAQCTTHQKSGPEGARLSKGHNSGPQCWLSIYTRIHIPVYIHMGNIGDRSCGEYIEKHLPRQTAPLVDRLLTAPIGDRFWLVVPVCLFTYTAPIGGRLSDEQWPGFGDRYCAEYIARTSPARWLPFGTAFLMAPIGDHYCGERPQLATAFWGVAQGWQFTYMAPLGTAFLSYTYARQDIWPALGTPIVTAPLGTAQLLGGYLYACVYGWPALGTAIVMAPIGDRCSRERYLLGTASVLSTYTTHLSAPMLTTIGDCLCGNGMMAPLATVCMTAPVGDRFSDGPTWDCLSDGPQWRLLDIKIVPNGGHLYKTGIHILLTTQAVPNGDRVCRQASMYHLPKKQLPMGAIILFTTKTVPNGNIRAEKCCSGSHHDRSREQRSSMGANSGLEITAVCLERWAYMYHSREKRGLSVQRGVFDIHTIIAILNAGVYITLTTKAVPNGGRLWRQAYIVPLTTRAVPNVGHPSREQGGPQWGPSVQRGVLYDVLSTITVPSAGHTTYQNHGPPWGLSVRERSPILAICVDGHPCMTHQTSGLEWGPSLWRGVVVVVVVDTLSTIAVPNAGHTTFQKSGPQWGLSVREA